MSKSNVNPDHYKLAGRARQGEDIAQIRHKQKYAEALVLERTEKRARSRKPVPKDRAALPGAAPTRSAKTTARKTQAKSPKAGPRAALRPTSGAPRLNAKQATKQASVNLQGADKRGKRSTAQKRASARHEFDPMPATKAVAGAFGKEPSPRWSRTRKG
jgi:hypothetical protein